MSDSPSNRDPQSEVNEIIENVIESSIKIIDWLKPSRETVSLPSAKKYALITMLPMKFVSPSYGLHRRKRFQSVRERNASRNSRLAANNNRELTEEQCQSHSRQGGGHSYSSSSEDDSNGSTNYLHYPHPSDKAEDYGESSNDNYNINKFISQQQLDCNIQTSNALSRITPKWDSKIENYSNTTDDSFRYMDIENNKIFAKSHPNTSSDDFKTQLRLQSLSHTSLSSAREIKDLSFIKRVVNLNVSDTDTSNNSSKQTLEISQKPSILPIGAVESFYCPQCMGRKFFHCDSLGQHMLTCHNLNLKHDDLKKLNAISYTKQYSISESNQRTLITSNDNRKRLYSRPFGQPPHPKQLSQKKISKGQFDKVVNTENEISLVEILPVSKARSDDGEITCLKCDYSFMKEDEFYQHIKRTHVWSDEEMQKLIHKGAEQSEFWCPECDQTFVTKAALCMHIKGNHEFLTDIPAYLEKIGYEGKLLQENQCEICFSLFNESWELEKHFRTHGMAFLRRQQILALLRK